MLYHILYPLSETFIGFNVLKYITFRTFAALFTAMILYLALGKPWIRYLRNKQMGQAIRTDGPQSHLGKKGTPTMGGVLVVGAILVSVLLWGNLSNLYVWASLFVFTA